MDYLSFLLRFTIWQQVSVLSLQSMCLKQRKRVTLSEIEEEEIDAENLQILLVVGQSSRKRWPSLLSAINLIEHLWDVLDKQV